MVEREKTMWKRTKIQFMVSIEGMGDWGWTDQKAAAHSFSKHLEKAFREMGYHTVHMIVDYGDREPIVEKNGNNNIADQKRENNAINQCVRNTWAEWYATVGEIEFMPLASVYYTKL